MLHPFSVAVEAKLIRLLLPTPEISCCFGVPHYRRLLLASLSFASATLPHPNTFIKTAFFFVALIFKCGFEFV